MLVRNLAKGLLAATLLSSAALASEPAATINADPALWVVKDADTTIYLFGTVHVLRPNVAWLDGGVKAAYDASSEIVMELLEPEASVAQKVVMEKAIDPDGPALTAKLSPEQRKAFEAAMQGLGLPAAAFDQFEPWFAATALTMMSIQKAGFSGDSGVERQLTVQAKKDGKALGELETFEQQLDFFDTMPEPLQLSFLGATVAEIGKSTEMLDAMVVSWAKGDPDALAAQMNASSMITPEVAKLLLTDRNARWAEWIAKRLEKPGTVFVAVGAGHLAGKDSVQDFLKAKKLEAKRIAS